MVPLDELRLLEKEIEDASALDVLRPIYDRLGQLARVNEGDFEVELVVADLRERLVHKGVSLRRQTGAARPSGPTPGPLRAWFYHTGKLDLRRTLTAGAVLGVTVCLGLFITLVQLARLRNMPETGPANVLASSGSPVSGSVPVDIVTTPPGATIQIDRDTKCTSNCRVNLMPGNYQVTAMLDGFDPVATGVTVVPGSPINVTLTLLNQAQPVRIFTDLASGKVFLDGQPQPDLQDGQLVLDRVRNGKHDLVVSSPTGEARMSFELAAGKAPVVTGPIVVNSLISVVVGSFGGNAHVQSSSPKVKVALNGQPQGETSPEGLDLKNVPAGDQQLSIGEGPDQRKMVVSFGPMPALTAFLKSDVNSGTLVVSTVEDDVTVFLNDKEYRRKTRRGQLRIPVLGKVAVRVAKEGFQVEPEQSAEVAKGEETRLAFHLRPSPEVASLQLHGAAPGMQVTIDDRSFGRVAADGSFSAANLTPGERVIELRRDGFTPKRLPKTFRAGETTILGGADVTLSAATATLHLILSPADTQVTYHRVDEKEIHMASGNSLRLDAGNYVFTAKAPNHVERSERIPVVSGETRNLEITLARESAAPTTVKSAPPPATSVQDWSGWSNQSGEHVRKGGNRVPVRSGALNGTITFTAQLRKGGIFGGGKLRWFLDDGGKISQFEIDKKHFYAKSAQDTNGEKLTHDEVDQKKYTVQIDIAPDRITQKLKVDDKWVLLGSAPGKTIANGAFGFVIPGNDEIAVSDFRFSPKN